ncbi:MAG: Hpt domain-containing protein [Propionibacterium sp.]|nr:Hpt domain-containing protein [Propionibacterium sp.]
MTIAPVLDATELAELGEQLGDLDALHRFVDRYATMLDQRVERLDHALDAQDLDDWQDAALSLRTSSAMAGATALSQLIREAESYLVANPHWPRPDVQKEFMTGLRQLAAATERELRSFLARPFATA